MLLFSNKAQISISIIEAELSTLWAAYHVAFFTIPLSLNSAFQKQFKKNSTHNSRPNKHTVCPALHYKPNNPALQKPHRLFLKTPKLQGAGISPPLYTNLAFFLFSLFKTSAFWPALICPSTTNSSSFLPTPLLSPAK